MDIMYDALYVDLIQRTSFAYGAVSVFLFVLIWLVIDGFLNRRFRWWRL